MPQVTSPCLICGERPFSGDRVLEVSLYFRDDRRGDFVTNDRTDLAHLDCLIDARRSA